MHFDHARARSVPVTLRPEQLRAAVWFIPLSHLASSLRSLNQGEIGLELLGHLAWMVVVGTVFAWFALGRMRGRLIK